MPAIGLAGLAVVPYRGWTDDAPGTEIQNAGDAASPHGPRGGTGPGGIGNYQVTATRETSFRSASSLRAQRAAVPGRPGERATRPMITLSTCATPEDHAVGNYWSDRFGNPEHRIDKIGVLVRSRPLGRAARG